MWITGSYDPVLNLTYWGTAQAKPWMTLTRGTEGDALYSSSTIAINPDDGKTEVVLPTRSGRGARSRYRVRTRPGGYRQPESGVHDRQGRHSLETRSQNRTSISVTKRPSFKTSGRSSIQSRVSRLIAKTSFTKTLGKPVDACPTSAGGHNWPATSYNPPTGLLIAPLVQACQVMVPSGGQPRR